MNWTSPTIANCKGSALTVDKLRRLSLIAKATADVGLIYIGNGRYAEAGWGNAFDFAGSQIYQRPTW